jgi:AraC-like DNA-binding protein
MPNHELTAAEASNMDKRNARLKRLIQFVDENYRNKIRLSDFVEAEGCSMSYLSHFIKDTMNQTFQEYVTSVRVGCACKLIAAGGRRMLDVCMESGFSDYRYFSKAFQKQYGMTPEAYSRNAQGGRGKNAVRRSIHSEERFYSEEESLMILEKLNQ